MFFSHLFNVLSLWLLCIYFLFSSEMVHSQTSIKYNAPIQQNDVQKDYFVLLLKEVCKTIETLTSPCALTPVDLPMLQQRQLHSLDNGLLDVVWTVTTKARESQFLAIPIPLMDGLIGYRIAVLNKRHQHLFTEHSDLDKIKRLRLAQGHDWPDASILRQNGFNVIETSWYDTLYKDTAAGIFDFTLRGVLEVYSEFDKFQQDNVIIDENLLFKYPSHIYFFVKKDNVVLAENITKALIHLKQTGKFDVFLTEYESHKLALKKANLQNRQVITLQNNN